MGVIPSTYQRVEYLESSGTQWIETNYIPPSGVTVEWDYCITGTFTGDRMLWGARDGTSTGRCYAERYGDRWYASNGNVRYANVLSGAGTTIGTKYHATMDSSALVIDGNSASPSDTFAVSPGIEIYIFAWNNNGTADWKHTVLRMYGLKFSYNGSVQAYFIPCVRISDDEPGMYDTVSGTFYTNAGTGEFVVGPDVITTEVSEWLMTRRRALMVQTHVSDWRDLYQQVAYLESSGTQCIDTGYIPTINTNVLLKKGANTGGVYNFLFGNGSGSDQVSVGAQYINYFSKVNQTTSGNLQNSACTLEINGGIVYIDGQQVLDLSSATAATATHSTAIYCRHNESGYERFTAFKVYEFKMWEGNTPVRDMIPCYRKADNKPGMYDTVSGTFFTNAGTGEFVVGPDVTSEGYIKSGLVLFLDGLNRGGVSGEWHDLIDPGNICTLTGDYTEQTNGVNFLASSTPYGYGTFANAPSVSKDTGTIEIVTEIAADETTGRPVVSIANDYLGASIAHGSTGAVYLRFYCYSGTQNAAYRFDDVISQTKHTASMNAARGICNGEAGELISISAWSKSGTSGLLAGRGTGNPFKGTIYAVRIYNRQLTEAEMLHNQRIDNARFNLGLTI